MQLEKLNLNSQQKSPRLKIVANSTQHEEISKAIVYRWIVRRKFCVCVQKWLGCRMTIRSQSGEQRCGSEKNNAFKNNGVPFKLGAFNRFKILSNSKLPKTVFESETFERAPHRLAVLWKREIWMSNSLTQTLNAVAIDGWQISGPKVLWTKFAIRNQISEILGSGPLERDAVPTIRFLPKCSKITIKTNQHQLGLDIQSICPGCVPWLCGLAIQKPN